MAKKKKEFGKEPVYEKIGSQSCTYETIPIPEGATHVEMELDYSSCYYESDTPSCIAIFYKKKES